MKVKTNQVRLPAHVKPERYKIMLKPDLNEFTFTGEETIYLLLEKPTKQITLHSVDLEIESAEFIHRNKDLPAGRQEIWAGMISYHTKAETASFTFPKQIQKGKGELKLIFRGILNDKMRGFYRSKYEMKGQEKYLATTQFESTDARRAFPCFDEPSQKAIFDVTLMIPGHTTAISNTIESNILEHESGYKVVEFIPTPKMSTYLLAFIVGEFEYIEGRTHPSSLRKQGSINKQACDPLDLNIGMDSRLRGNDNGTLVRVFTIPGKKDQAEFALDVAIKCLEFYNNYFGIHYPLPVLDMIAIPDFATGAMENWGAVTYRESTLLFDEEHSSSANKQRVALVIAHELAHQWFGNLVTMEWWSELWLNEGFASFIEFLAIDEIFPEFDVWTQFVSTEMADAFALDSLKNTHPIEVEVSDPAEISEIFDRVSYSKGASVLRMLWSYLGEKDFQKGLCLYLKKHAYSNATTSDLWIALEEVSKKPVGKIMENWTKKAGHPVINVKCKVKSDKLELTQSRFFSSAIAKRESKDKTIWSIPLSSLRMQGSNKQESRSELDSRLRGNDSPLLMDKKSMIIPNSGEKLNAGEMSLVRVDYPKNYLKRLGKLPAPDRLGLIRDSFDLAQSGNSPTTLALELAQNYKNEQDYTVWSELTGQISKMESLLAYEPYFENYRNYSRKIYENIAKKMGWQKRKGEKHTDALLRGMVLYKLGSFGDLETIRKAQDLFRKGTIDPDLRNVVYNLVAKNGSKKEFETLVKMYKEEENQQEKDRIGRSLGLFKSKTILQKTLDFSISKHVRYQNSLQIIASVWGNPQGRYLAWEFVKKNWSSIREKYAGGYLLSRLTQSASEFTTKGVARDLQIFFQKNPTPEVKRTVDQALEQIDSNAEWLKRDREKIRKFLEKSVSE